MELFEGEEGPRLFKRKKDAKFVAEKNNLISESHFDIQKVRISDEKLAEESGISVHPDLSIAARKPKKEETGWIVLSENENFKKKVGGALISLEE